MSKKSKQSKDIQRNTSAFVAPFSICHLDYPFIALSISQSPSLWSERLISDIGTDIPWIPGSNIELPIFENEYRVECGEHGNDDLPNFLMHMDALASFRLFHFSGCNDLFICTDADEQTVNVALALARQTSG